ncbi:uncharacterized protein LOC129763347 [Toxorhynchites rutilus septentrionalis]|uniref:uncharacterized protein LOC129763347 n=1 Tax=Toxorhynchites rutilus septentrionalis TaxID=329112 RepID=UPI0024794F8C|nr:uncharacterized protein LOC129763347 [Toxorhynchites rutilus septentrionalis]
MQRQSSFEESGGEESLVSDVSGYHIPSLQWSLPQRMLMHVYESSGIATARSLAFWEKFLELNPDIELRAQDLRMQFFGDVLHEAKHYEELPSTVIGYINPMFNEIPLEALEFGDLTEGEDFMVNVLVSDIPAGLGLEELVNNINVPPSAARKIPLAPMNLDLAKAPRPTVATATAEDDLYKGFSRLLSELVWTNEETVEKPILSPLELRERVSALTKAGIALSDLVGLQMDSFQPPVVQIEENQLGPTTSSRTPTPAKRYKSFDDSGLGLSPRKRARLLTPSTLTIRKQKLKRNASAPTEN